MVKSKDSIGNGTKVTALDGRKGGALDPKDQNESSNDDGVQTRENKLRSQKRKDLVAAGKEAIDELNDYSDDRTSINDSMNAIRSKLQAKGISKKALAIAVQISKMEDDELDGLWLSLDILSEAINRPIQKDLFKARKVKAA